MASGTSILQQQITIMNLTCAILHADNNVTEQLKMFIDKTHFLSLCGEYTDPAQALKEYYEKRADIYFIGLRHNEMEGLNGMEFSKLLSPYTRVIFIADTPQYAATCFRLDALDYLVNEVSFLTFFEAVNKAARWFNLKGEASKTSNITSSKDEAQTPKVIYVKSGTRIIQLNMANICYIEGLGDYVKIYSKDEPKPILGLYSMKYIENKLPADDFIRVHRSFIIRKDCIRSIEGNSITLEKRNIPIGDVYRKGLKSYVSDYSIL